MTLTSGEVAAIVRQGVDRLDPAIPVDLEPGGGFDPYGRGEAWWTAWPLIDGHRAFGIVLSATDTPAEMLARVLDTLSNDASESERFWGRPFPPCPRHAHPLRFEAADAVVELRCPTDGDVVERVSPA